MWLLSLYITITYGYNFWGALVGAILMGSMWQNIVFLGHDFGHNHWTHTSKGDWGPGLWVSILVGISGNWWKDNHNVHHIITNDIHNDPNIQHLPIMSISEKTFKGYFSKYYNR